MSELIVLIDIDDKNLEELVVQVNELKPANVWVGCSTSSGQQALETIQMLDVSITLYPGNFDQIKYAFPFAQSIYLSDPLFFTNQSIPRQYMEAVNFSLEHFPHKIQFMNYVVMHPNCTAAKVLGVKEESSNERILDSLRDTKVHPTIYLEGGSRNKDHSIKSRTSLIENIKSRYLQSNVIYGGGIHQIDDARFLKDMDVSVLVSNQFHEEPETLEAYMRLFD